MKVKVFFTVDVEVWCGAWDDLDSRFPEAFRRYIYGSTKRGQYGLPRTLERLNHYGLKGVFFTEPLFSRRFGHAALEEIVGLVLAAGQEIQLHLHTEWADEAEPPLVPGLRDKRQHLWMFDCAEQELLIRLGLDLLEKAGGKGINAFRAGSFGMNIETWRALAKIGIPFDSSFNGLFASTREDLASYVTVHQPMDVAGVWSYPMTIFEDARGHLRHAQLGACSFSELEWLLWRAAEEEWASVVLLSHNFELMNQAKTAPDPVVTKRFERLCRFLASNTDAFETSGFQGLIPQPRAQAVDIPRAGISVTLCRMAEQALRRLYG